MGKKEYLLIVVMYSSLLAGLVFPESSAAISGTIKYLMMTMLFLAFIKISPEDVKNAFVYNSAAIAKGSFCCLILAPAAVYWAAHFLYPPLAFPVLLLAGASTGVSAPFFTSICRGNISYCLLMAIVTSILMPISLPLTVRLLASMRLDYELTEMALFLSMVIFVPLVLAFICRKLAPGLLASFDRISFPFSLVVLVGINFGALGKYAEYLQANPAQIMLCLAFAIGLAMILAAMGWYLSKGNVWEERMASSGSQIWVNNILIIALAVHIDNPLAATLSAVYLIPYYGFVGVYSHMYSRLKSMPTEDTKSVTAEP